MPIEKLNMDKDIEPGDNVDWIIAAKLNELVDDNKKLWEAVNKLIEITVIEAWEIDAEGKRKRVI